MPDRHRHLILHRHTKFHVNRTIGGVVNKIVKMAAVDVANQLPVAL